MMIKAVTYVSAEDYAARRRAGLDRRDEIWDGELHMPPAAHEEHGHLNDELGMFFGPHWQDLGLGKTRPEANVRRPDAPPAPAELGADLPSDYRIPDRSFLLPARYDRLQQGWIVGGPDVVLEILSPPGDESLGKLPFYFEVGVREVILIDRETRAVQILRRGATAFEPVASDEDGWHRSALLRAELRTEPSAGAARRPILHVRRTDAPERARLIGD